MMLQRGRVAGHIFAALLLFAATVAQAQSTDLESNWVVAVGEDPASYEVMASIQQDSANTIKDEYASKDVTPRLKFLCAPGSPEISAQIDWQRFISSFNTEVGFKVDGGKTLWLKWGVDRSNKITLSPSVADTQSLIDRLGEGKTLQVEVSPYSESPVTVEFELSGFLSGLDRLRKECTQGTP